MRLGAHRIVVSRDPAQLSAARGSLDFILSTVSTGTNWQLYFDCLAPKGRLHSVGAITDQIAAAVLPMCVGQQSLSGSPVGSPATAALMLEFCHRHGIAPVTEVFPMSRVNDAIAHIKEGKAHYRVVLRNDFD